MPPGDDKDNLLFEGACGWYRQVDLESFGDTGVLVPFDSDLKALGFVFLGDLLCSAVALGVLRIYVSRENRTRAMVLVGTKNGALNVFGVFLDSRFADGAVATTTTSRAVKNLPDKGIHRTVCAWKGMFALNDEHQKHLNQVKLIHGEPEPADDTLSAVAKTLDSFSVRMNQATQGSGALC